MRFLLLALFTLTTLFISRQARAQWMIGGFMQGHRKASLAIIGSQESYSTYFINKTETKNPNLGTVTTQALTAVGTYGLGYDLDLIVAAPYIRTEASAGYFPKQEGFQDASATLRWEAYDYKLGKKLRLSWLFAVGYSMPIQNYVNDAMVAIGRGSKNWDGRTMLHLKGKSFFITGQYGYIRRGQVTLDHVVNYYDPSQLNPNSGSKVNVPDVTEIIVRGGYVNTWLNLDVWGQQQTPYTKGTDIGPGIPFPTNAVGFTRLGATAYLRLAKQFGLTAGYNTIIDGRNVGKSSQINAGLVIGHWTANN
ncbi:MULTISPECIES: hypothetical protein [unclassified Spirosoma]|uniref:hypothetical protein n=1 Tax=unclassified Spirosoma TaxID=2621999 RepID=UPI000961E85B|nr:MULTISPECIES: hypothetical protein [unclassified Spirosoma]MBN8821725.1 hypothetical protein [Spirosoma sp.]OJW80780.1 MAG: hypothetical protein BGO59_35565 [Spirosoma sp. 48-14]